MKSFVPKALVAVFLASLLPIYWVAFHAPAVGIYHDDGIYLVTAKALAEGKGYRIISLPDEPPQTKYPVLFPAVLSVAWRVSPKFPDNALFLKTIPLLSAILWLCLSYKLIREETGSHYVALWVVLITAASSWVVFFSTTFMSETFFACFATGALICLRRLEGTWSSERGNRILLLSTILVAASFLTRTVGAPLVAAAAVSLFLRKRYGPCLMFLFGFAVLVAPWFWWQAVHGDLNRPMESYYSFSNYKGWNIIVNFTMEQKIRVLYTNILRLLFSPIKLLNMNGNIASIFISLVLSLLTFFGFIRDMRQSVSLLHLFIMFYLITIMMWVWPPDRFVVPVIPFLLLFAYRGLSGICEKLFQSKSLKTAATFILVCSIGIPLVYNLILCTKETMKYHAVSLSYVSSIYGQDNWEDTRELLDWIRQNTSQDSILLGNLDPTYYLYTGRKSIRSFTDDPYRLFFSEKPETAMGQVPDLVQRIVANRVKYIIRTPSIFYKEGPIFNKILDRFIFSYPEVLHLVKKGADPSYKVYEVDQGKLLQALQSGELKKRDGYGRNYTLP